MKKIAINGFGRIGRLTLRHLLEIGGMTFKLLPLTT